MPRNPYRHSVAQEVFVGMVPREQLQMLWESLQIVWSRESLQITWFPGSRYSHSLGRCNGGLVVLQTIWCPGNLHRQWCPGSVCKLFGGSPYRPYRRGQSVFINYLEVGETLKDQLKLKSFHSGRAESKRFLQIIFIYGVYNIKRPSPISYPPSCFQYNTWHIFERRLLKSINLT